MNDLFDYVFKNTKRVEAYKIAGSQHMKA